MSVITCDHYRSKKIRCGGIRPSHTPCANVGFECRTSDKLSRQAFSQGYTESLGKSVRILEAETQELKELLDEKDTRTVAPAGIASEYRPCSRRDV